MDAPILVPISAQSVGPADELDTPILVPISTQSTGPADELDAAIRAASDYLNKQLPKGNKLVILNVLSEFPALSEYIIDELIANTVNDRVFTVVDRQQLNTIRAELEFHASGEVSDESAQSIGQILGAQIIISGAVSRIGDLYRLRVRALSVQSAQIAGQFNRNIPDGPTIAALVRSRATGYGDGTATPTAPVGTPAPASAVLAATPAPASAAPAALSTSPTVPAGQVAAPATVAAQPASPEPVYKIGQKGAAGGFVFYDQDPPPASRPVSQAVPTTQTYTVGQNGPAGGLTFYDSEPKAVLAAAPVQSSVTYKVGDKGPAGGIIFYVNPSATGGWRYLEAAPASTEGKALQWSVSAFDANAKGVEVGTGKQNTRNIMDVSIQVAINVPAARLCDRLEYGGYDDWYLPSKNELGLMYMNLKVDGIGSFSNEWYWSSSENGKDHSWLQNFGNGAQNDGYYNYNFYYKGRGSNVRAIRQF
jgi:hypothetical protein